MTISDVYTLPKAYGMVVTANKLLEFLAPLPGDVSILSAEVSLYDLNAGAVVELPDSAFFDGASIYQWVSGSLLIANHGYRLVINYTDTAGRTDGGVLVLNAFAGLGPDTSTSVPGPPPATTLPSGATATVTGAEGVLVGSASLAAVGGSAPGGAPSVPFGGMVGVGGTTPGGHGSLVGIAPGAFRTKHAGVTGTGSGGGGTLTGTGPAPLGSGVSSDQLAAVAVDLEGSASLVATSTDGSGAQGFALSSLSAVGASASSASGSLTASGVLKAKKSATVSGGNAGSLISLAGSLTAVGLTVSGASGAPSPSEDDDVAYYSASVPYSQSGLYEGLSFYTPSAGDLSIDFQIFLETNWVGATPAFLDIGLWSTPGPGLFQVLSAMGGPGPINLTTTVVDSYLPGHNGLLVATRTLSYSAILDAIAFSGSNLVPASQPPASWGLVQSVGGIVLPFGVVVSQDGSTYAPLAATVTAAATINPSVGSPFVVTTGTNDQFTYTPTDPTLGGGGGGSITFTMQQNLSGYTTPAALEAAVAAATVGGTYNPAHTPFSAYCSVGDNNNGGGPCNIVLTALAPTGGSNTQTVGAAANNNVLGPSPNSRDISVQLGFTVQGTLGGGQGGDPGATAGAAIIVLGTVTPRSATLA